MNTQFWVIQAFNGISYGALLFLVGSGLSLIFGVMRIVNLSHGAYFLWGGYIALSVIAATGSWALSLPLAALAVAVIGLLMERLFLRSEGFEYVRNAIIAAGVAVLIGLAVGALEAIDRRQLGRACCRGRAGRHRRSISCCSAFPLSRSKPTCCGRCCSPSALPFCSSRPRSTSGAATTWTSRRPPMFNTSVVIGGIYFPLYRVFMIAMAVAIGLVIWLVMEKTRMGAAVRATVDDAQMARGVGIDTNRVSMFIFALGAFLAALGGVIGGAFLGIYPGLDFEMLPLAFAVVIIGGMGSLGGAAIGALAVGLADNFGKALFPEISYFTLYAPMVLILAVKPTGLFGRE